jgi:inhibitor of KinA
VNVKTQPRLTPLGDQAVLAYLHDETAALRFAAAVRAAAPSWLIDVVQAYVSVAVFFDLDKIHYPAAAAMLQPLLTAEHPAGATGRRHVIPCCYDLNLDLDRIAIHCGLSRDSVIRLHTATEYTVYAIGFCPGFPYLGYLPPELSGVPRLESPRLRVESGSVGLTGRQTGIYTEVRPGGWNILGRTPLELVNVADGYFPLRTGDTIRFEAMTPTEYERWHGQRLT